MTIAILDGTGPQGRGLGFYCCRNAVLLVTKSEHAMEVAEHLLSFTRKQHQ